MKLKKELIERLAKGEIQLENTLTVEPLRCVLQAAFPKSVGRITGSGRYYRKSKCRNHFESTYNSSDLPIYTTEQFFEPNQRPSVQEKLDSQTRELAKQLFVAFIRAGHLPAHNSMSRAIEAATEFVRILDEA